MAKTFYQVDTEDFSNKKWPISKSGPEPRALWRMCMYIVKLHIIPKDDQKKKKKNSKRFYRLVSAFTGFRHRASQSTTSIGSVFSWTTLERMYSILRCLTLDRTRNRTDSYAFVGGKKGTKRKCFMQSPCLWCTRANCPDPERWCVCVWTRPVVVVVFLVVVVLVLSTISSYRAFVTVSFRSFALLCLFERICRRCRNSSCWPLCVMTTELTASYYTFTVSVCKRKIMFDHVHFYFFFASDKHFTPVCL